MKVIPFKKIPDVKIVEPDIFFDERGFFYESFNLKKFNDEVDDNIIFVQDNYSKSLKGVLRGLHYQSFPFIQGKLVAVTFGEVFDVAVDLRKNSKTFGEYVFAYLSDENKKQLWIPEGFAHGFLTLSDYAHFSYKTTNYYSKENELCLRYDDKTIDINWPKDINIILSDKDKKALSLEQIMASI